MERRRWEVKGEIVTDIWNTLKHIALLDILFCFLMLNTLWNIDVQIISQRWIIKKQNPVFEV